MSARHSRLRLANRVNGGALRGMKAGLATYRREAIPWLSQRGEIELRRNLSTKRGPSPGDAE